MPSSHLRGPHSGQPEEDPAASGLAQLAGRPPGDAPFFIVGSGRSGSTMLRMMLASHSRLAIPPETWYLLPLLERFGIDRPLDPDEIGSAVAIITDHYRWPDMKLDAQEFGRQVNELTNPNLRDVVEVVYRWHMQLDAKVRWGDKTPVYIEILPKLAEMFPDSKFIHLVRDGRDVAKSFQVQGWLGRWLHENTREWTRAIECQRLWAASRFRERILQVRYEDLVLQTESTLRQICNFIGEEFEPQMLSWDKRVDDQVPARELAIHAKLKLQVGPEGVARWKREMTAREVLVAEAFMGAQLAQLGYERRYPGRGWAPVLAATRLYCRAVLPAVDLQSRALRYLRNRLRPSQGASSAPFDAGTLDKHLVGGIAWTAGAKWSSQILTWLSLLIVARLLVPADFGLVGMAAVYLGVVGNFSEFGFGSALVTLRDLTADDAAQINTFAVISGIAGFLVSGALAVPMGWFFRAPQLPEVIVVMGTAFLVGGFRTVPNSLLQRELRFKRLSVIDTLSAITQSLCVLLLAWMKAGYWALVVGSVIGAAVSTALNVASHPCGFARPRLRSIGHALTFSWQVLVARLSWNLYNDADDLVAGRVLGAPALGAYAFAWNLATLPVEKVTALVAQVTPAFFSASQSDHGGLCRYLRSLTEALSLVTFPAAIGLAMVAPEFVTLVLGKRWLGVIAPLEVLAFYASIRSVSALLGPLLTALRETRFLMWNNLMALAIMPTAFFVGSRWGASGIACGWIVGYPFVVLPLYVRTLRKIGMPARTYLGAIRPALNGSLAMILALILLKAAIPPNWPLELRFGAEVLGGGAAYLSVLALLHADRMRSFLSLYRRIRASARPNAIATG